MFQSTAQEYGAPFSAASILDELNRAAELDCEAPTLKLGAPQENRSEVARALSTMTGQARNAAFSRPSEQIEIEFSFLLKCLVTTSTIEEAIRDYLGFSACFWSDVCTLWAEDMDDRVFIGANPKIKDCNKMFLHDLRACSIMLSTLSWISGDALSDMRAHFAYLPIDEEKVRSIFPYRFSRDSSVTGFSLRKDELRSAVVRPRSEIEAFVKAAPMIALRGSDSCSTYSRRVSAIIERDLRMRGEITTVTDICDDLALSAATLHRKLSAEGTSFRKLRDTAVNLTAKDLIQRTDAGIAAISEMLGYSEETAFRRSFVRWNGCSPAAYRQRVRAVQ